MIVNPTRAIPIGCPKIVLGIVTTISFMPNGAMSMTYNPSHIHMQLVAPVGAVVPQMRLGFAVNAC